MTKNTTGYFLKDDVYTRTVFQPADTTTIKDIATAGANGSYVYLLNITSENTGASAMTIYMSNGVVDVPIKIPSIINNYGNSAANPDPLALINVDISFIVGRVFDRDQNYYIPLPAGWKLRAKLNATIPTGNMTFLVHQKDF